MEGILYTFERCINNIPHAKYTCDRYIFSPVCTKKFLNFMSNVISREPFKYYV